MSINDQEHTVSIKCREKSTLSTRHSHSFLQTGMLAPFFFPFVLFSFSLFLFFCLFDWTEVIALILFKKWLLHTPWQSHQLASLTIIYKNKCEKVPALL